MKNLSGLILCSLMLLTSNILAAGKAMPNSPATFDFCACEASTYTGNVGVAKLMGKSFVKKADGSISLQEQVLNTWEYNSNSYWEPSSSIVLGLCTSAKKSFIKQRICPAE